MSQEAERTPRTFEFTDRALKGLPIPPKPKQLDYFDAKARGLGLRISYGGARASLRCTPTVRASASG